MLWSNILLIGDSITQQAFSLQGRWGALLADRFQRMADITARGFSGYNTRWYKIILPTILDSIKAKDISCVTIFLGANDCCLPTTDQHVPVDEYQDNLEAMVGILENRGIERQKIVFITPPTYFHSHFTEAELKDGKPEPSRNDEQQKIYAKAMTELGQRLCLSVVDTYSAFESDGRGDKLFVDGLHFSTEGADLLYDLVAKEIEKRVLAFRGETGATETVNYARWKDVDPQDLERTIFQTGKNDD